MIKVLKKSLDIDITYSTNSILYILRRIPVLKDLITSDVYQNSGFKKFIRIIAIVWSFIKTWSLKFFYFFLIFSLSYYYFPDTMVKTYFHVYTILTLLGIFLNNKLLNMNKKIYFSILLFQVDVKKYLKASILWNQFSNLVLNSICIFFFGYLMSSPIYYSILLLVLTFFARFIGEVWNIVFFRKKKYIWYSNLKLYWFLLFFFLGVGALPFWNLYLSFTGIFWITIGIVLLGIFSFVYLWNITDYKLLVKKITQMAHVMDSKNEKDYYKQAMVSVREKDKKIDRKKIEGKKGYDLFHTIFYERHKEILIRSSKKYTVICIVVYAIICYVCWKDENTASSVKNFLEMKLGWFAVIMYFINRGAIITQAMFFNCDHAMLTYNFYREPKTMLSLFQKRLTTIIKVNLLPATIIGIGNTLLLVMLGNHNGVTFFTTFLFIIFLSIFFSVHYMVIYYLLQPFNQNLEVKKASYSFATLITYMISYMLTDVVINSILLSILGLLFTVLYIGVSLFLVYRYAPKTFKLN